MARANVAMHTDGAGWTNTAASVWQDVRYAVRMMRKSPAFAAAAIVTLGLGIGGTTAVFSIVDALFLRAPAGVSEPDLVRRVFVKRDAGQLQSRSGSAGLWPDARGVRDGSRAFAGIAAYQTPQLVDLGRGESATRVRASVVSREFLDVLGVRPARGRLFLPEDAAAAAEPVVVISHATWQSRFGGADDVLGRMLLINNRPVRIAGVTPRGFDGIDADAADLWVTTAEAVYVGLERDSGWQDSLLTMSGLTRHVARLWSAEDQDRAAGDASAALAAIAATDPALDPTPEVALSPLQLAALPGPSWVVDLSLWLLVAAALVLVISCANVANLLLARGIARRREFATRLSLGAGGWRLARLQLTESALLGLLGGVVGLVVAYFGVALLQQFPLPPAAGRIDVRLLVFSTGLSFLTALAFGVLPALAAMRLDPGQVLKGAQAPGGMARHRTRLTLVVLQVSLSFALLVGAALFVRSLGQVSAIRGGADLDRLLTVQLNLSTDDATRTSRAYDEFFELALSRLSLMPGVERAAIVHTPPFAWAWPAMWQGPDGRMTAGAHVNLVGPDYFEAAGTRLLRGRTIQASDDAGAEPVVVVNEAMAGLIVNDGNVLGRCVTVSGPRGLPRPCLQIVGVVESQRKDFLDPAPIPMMFRPVAQAPDALPNSSPMLLVRTAGASTAHATAVHAALQGLRGDLPFVSVAPLAEELRNSLRPFRLGAMLFTLFGALALILSAVGLHAVLGYFVAERTGEVGIRRALGAPAIAVMRLVVRQSLVPVAAGLVIGLGASLLVARAVASRLFGIEPHDPVSIAAAAACLMAIAGLATLVPVWRAIRIDPMIALRRD